MLAYSITKMCETHAVSAQDFRSAKWNTCIMYVPLTKNLHIMSHTGQLKPLRDVHELLWDTQSVLQSHHTNWAQLFKVLQAVNSDVVYFVFVQHFKHSLKKC